MNPRASAQSTDVTRTTEYARFCAKVVGDLITCQMEAFDIRRKKLFKAMFDRHGRGIFVFMYTSVANVWALQPEPIERIVPVECRYSSVLGYMTVDQNSRSQTFKDAALDLQLQYNPALTVLVGCTAWFMEGGEDFVTSLCQIGGKGYLAKLERCGNSYHPRTLAKVAPTLGKVLTEDPANQRQALENLQHQLMSEELRKQNLHEKSPREIAERIANHFLPVELPSVAPSEFQPRLETLRTALVQKVEDHCKAVREDDDPVHRAIAKHKAAFATCVAPNALEAEFLSTVVAIVQSLQVLEVGIQAFGTEEKYAAAVRQCPSSLVADMQKHQETVDGKIQTIIASARGISESCRVCGNRGPRGQVLTCQGCKHVFYCGKDCRNADWKEKHKRECNKR
eukprot:TRINITY_DN17683_c0_g1_i2.p1 TRINITY_DN17683_c0_g1~~TRINITY_DN17683_c0_g1_i2.p1  ORF type:complete len:396 (+),score=56.04 TRINITY_DN17683_c0_g1_i2:39-1226(+)